VSGFWKSVEISHHQHLEVLRFGKRFPHSSKELVA
jgi:hypothetical protein